MDEKKITNHQLFSLTACSAFGGALIVISAALAGMAKQDAWITPLLTVVYGMPVIWIYWFLGSQYPNMTLVGILFKIFGNWIGFIFAAGFVSLCLRMIYVLPWYIGDFITLEAMPETPVSVINSLFVKVSVIALLYGIETIARASELFIYVASILFFLAMILVLPNARIEKLQPVLEKGIIPVFISSVILSCYVTFPIISLMMIYPVNVNNIPEAKKSLLKGYIWAIFLVFITILMAILVLGSVLTANFQYPTYILAKEINVSIIFTRLEFIIGSIWMLTHFMILLIFFYAGVTGLSELLGLKDHKKIVIPLGLIGSVMSQVVYPDIIYQANWSKFIWPLYIMTYGLILPVLLLLVFLIKKWVFRWT